MSRSEAVVIESIEVQEHLRVLFYLDILNKLLLLHCKHSKYMYAITCVVHKTCWKLIVLKNRWDHNLFVLLLKNLPKLKRCSRAKSQTFYSFLSSASWPLTKRCHIEEVPFLTCFSFIVKCCSYRTLLGPKTNTILINLIRDAFLRLA